MVELYHTLEAMITLLNISGSELYFVFIHLSVIVMESESKSIFSIFLVFSLSSIAICVSEGICDWQSSIIGIWSGGVCISAGFKYASIQCRSSVPAVSSSSFEPSAVESV